MVDYATVRQLLDYNPSTGAITWRVNRGRGVLAGMIAGWLCQNGYLYVWKIPAHRVIWLWMTGTWPAAQVDHIDENKLNNRWSNLRAATHSQNEMNTGSRGGKRTNKAGLKGVYFSTHRRLWIAEIRASGSKYRLGGFPTKEAAHAAYVAAASVLHGEYAHA